MVRYKVRPWRDQAELLRVRAALYLPNAPHTSAARAAACNTVDVWRRRLPLPHAISSSCLIVEAQLHKLQQHSDGSDLGTGSSDSISSSSKGPQTALRALFAAALARFVTGFCDINQGGAARRGMFDVAAGLGIPARWVELRHQATHGGELPALAVLEAACDGAMAWLWDAYWSRLDGAGGGVRGMGQGLEKGVVVVPPVGELRGVFRRYVDGRRGEIKSLGPESARRGLRAVADALAAVLQFAAGHEGAVDALLYLLVDESLIVPSRRAMRDSMAGAFLLWDALLMDLSLHVRGFLPLLSLRLVAAVTAASDADEAHDPSKEALELWLEHIFTSKAWRPRRDRSKDGLRALRHEVLKECVLAPGHWTNKLSQAVHRRLGHDGGEGGLKEMCDAAILSEEDGEDGDGDGAGRLDGNDVAPSPPDGQDYTLSETLGGWKPYSGKWRPSPIGIPQSAVAL